MELAHAKERLCRSHNQEVRKSGGQRTLSQPRGLLCVSDPGHDLFMHFGTVVFLTCHVFSLPVKKLSRGRYNMKVT